MRIDPVEQILKATYAARRYVETDYRWAESSRTGVRWGHAVVFPYTDLDVDFAVPSCPRWMANDRGDLRARASRLRSLLARQDRGRRPAEDDDIDLIAEILRGRNRPAFSVANEADEREAEADRLTQGS